MDKKEIKLQFCKTYEELVDIFTKATSEEKLIYFLGSSSKYKDVCRLRENVRN